MMVLQTPIHGEARTLHDIFTEYSRSPMKGPWSIFWDLFCMEHLKLYEELGWAIIAISEGEKVPLAEIAWATEPPLTRARAFDFLQQKCNIAIHAGPSKLAILDFDSKEISRELFEIIPETMTMCTPRGFAFPTLKPFNLRRYEVLRKKFPGFDKNARVGDMFELAPPSKTCTQDFGRRADHNCVRHDYRIREWIGPARTIFSFREFCDFLDVK